ncbi:hypothetical protein Dsin_018892 [Dipteronia sinensis]|uniref:Ubiquitin-like protease family profile domain-containing protein n=1 Tax=Dipteronia sinensis TaxID=43782 RepID=A0AAE0A6B6_9ROSI|nr:hypothetical protein Dsin_018892 [Dipteronia sinensis]
MGTLPEGFREKEEVRKDTILTRHFADESPTIELLEAIFNRLTEPVSGDDALKMGYLLMVSQFFGINEAPIAIHGWLFSLIEDNDAFERFLWGSYIFDVTMFWLKNAAGKHLGRLRGDGQKKEENEEKNKNKKEENNKSKKKEEKEEEKKKKKKPKKKKTEVEDGEEETDNDNQQNNDVVKYFTFHSYGFLLAFQVWAVERITRLEGKIGIRKGTEFPGFKNWNFNTRVLKVESYFSTKMALFPWKVYDIEKSSAYYKSLMLEDVVRDDREDAMEEGVASIHQSKTRTTLHASRNSNEPASKKRLFDGGDVETPKSKSKTSVPYTIPELYTSIKQLVTKQIKESEERMKSWLREEIGKIAKENKVGNTSTPKQSRESEEKDLDMDDNNRLDKMGQFVNEIHDGFSEKDQTSVETLQKDQTGVHTFEMDQTCVQTFGVEVGLDKQETENVIGEEGGLEADLDRVESWVHADTGGLDKEETENVVGEACGSAKQAINLDDFPSPSVNMILPNPNLNHIDNYLDVLWKRRSSREVSYPQDIGLVPTAHVNLKWKAVKRLLDSERSLQKFEAAEKDRLEQEKNDPAGLKQKEVKNITKKKMKKKEEIDLTPHANYYEPMTMPPHKSPFTAINIDGSIIPQQDDSYSCGAFLLKYAELILSGVSLSSWMDSFGQKDIPSFREAMALAIFVNGELDHS